MLARWTRTAMCHACALELAGPDVEASVMLAAEVPR